MNAENFSKWMTYFIHYHETRGNLSHTKRMLLILDGHKSHITLEVLLKAKTHGIDMVSLSSHTSHELQPLDISCFKPFKQAFRGYRDAWARRNIEKKVEKKELAQWVSLALQKALTTQNIQSDFRAVGIQSLNREAIVRKMGASEIFQESQVPRQPQEEDEPNHTNEDVYGIQVEEVMEEDLSLHQGITTTII